ncbi:MAG TPA: SMP-30/gluconolactonase/LRE family protein [Dongiaceae bacterium]|nr:SMP-30/gluconolactonase/LRE family protein [Dongiaceae bacterium]
MPTTTVLKYVRVIAAGVMLWAATATVVSGAAGIDTVATGLHFPEGVIFVGNTPYFVDYVTSNVLRIAGGKVEQVWHEDGCGANGLVALHGELLVACYDSGTIVRLTIAGQVRETVRHDESGGIFVSPNDLADDGAGGVYFTASGNGSVPGKIYYRDPLGRVKEVAGDIDYANGLAVSNDQKLLYVAESRKHRLLKFTIGTDGELSGRAEFANLAVILADRDHDVFTPDGLRIDKRGRLFVALYDGGGFAVLAEDGKLIKKIDLPAAHHASLAIAPDGKSLYLTATDDMPDGSYRGEILKVDNPLSD